MIQDSDIKWHDMVKRIVNYQVPSFANAFIFCASTHTLDFKALIISDRLWSQIRCFIMQRRTNLNFIYYCFFYFFPLLHIFLSPAWSTWHSESGKEGGVLSSYMLRIKRVNFFIISHIMWRYYKGLYKARNSGLIWASYEHYMKLILTA